MKSIRLVVQKAVIPVVLALGLTLSGPTTTAAADPCPVERWHLANNAPYTGLGFPETNTNYWTFKFNNTPGDHLRLRLSGGFPRARYMAYTLYNLDDDEDEGNPIRFNGAIQHLADAAIQPLEGHENPYVNGADRNAIVDRSYEIHVVHEDSNRILPDGQPMANTLVIPDDRERVALVIRVYVPDDPEDPLGEAALPVITPVSELTGSESSCPEQAEGSLTIDDVIVHDRLAREHILLPGNVIETWRAGDYGLFPNGDCPYLGTPLVPPIWNHDKVAVLRFKAPTFPDTRNGEQFSASDEVRYWSICIGDWVLTNTSACIADEEAVIDADGYVHLVIGPDYLTPSCSKWINLPWGLHADPILLFRQISPRGDFEGSFMHAEVAFDETSGTIILDEIYLNEPEKIAYNAIGAYAPRGTYCTKLQFLLNRCGLD